MSERGKESEQSDLANIPFPGLIVSETLKATETSLAVLWIYRGNENLTGTRLKWDLMGMEVGEFDVPWGQVRYVITSLKPNTEYRVRAYGVRGDDVSNQYASVRAATKPATSKPSSPTQLVATPTKDSMALTWSGPANASSYKLSYGVAPSGAVIKTESTSNTRHTFSALVPDTHYYFEVCSTNNNGDSDPTRVEKRTLQVPVAPTDLRASAAITTMDVQWSGSSGAIDYVVRYGVEPSGEVRTVTTSNLNQTLSDLIKNTLYFVQVNARNGNGESLPARITQKTEDGPDLPLKPVSVYLSELFDTIRAAWPSMEAPEYEVSYGLSENYPDVIARDRTPHLFYKTKYLSPNEIYFFEVRACNVTGCSPPAKAELKTGPDRTQPRNLAIPGRSFEEAWLKWDAPEDASYLIDYEITCPTRPTIHTTAREYIATGLRPGIVYEFKVQPRRPEGPVPALAASIDVITRDFEPPTRPQAVRFEASTPNSGILSWLPSKDNIAVTGYEVRRDEGAWVSVTGLSYSISNLMEGVGHTLEVRATDAAGNRSRRARIYLPAQV